MNANYFRASMSELFMLIIACIVVHYGLEIVTGVHVLSRAYTDFTNLPVPEWTWPTWLVLACVAVVALIELVYRVSTRTEKLIKRGSLTEHRPER